MTSNDEYVLNLLLENGILTREQISRAREQCKNTALTPLDVLIDDGTVPESTVLSVLGDHFAMEVVSLNNHNISPEVRDTISTELARRYKVVPVEKFGKVLKVAISDPFNLDTLDSLRHVLNYEVEGVIASASEIKSALDKYYAVESTMDTVVDEGNNPNVQVEIDTPSGTGETTTDADAPIIKLVTLIILEAVRNRASDIHLEPLEKRFRVRYRIDGVLHEVESPPKRLQAAIINRVKIMARMKISEKRIPQDGRIQVNVMGRELDLRVSSIPSHHGESIVMRILDKQSLLLGLPQLGFFSDDQQIFERLISCSDGILLVTGPTGSGKTTTLYACLQSINRPDRKIITVEDPVEYQISGINQVQVHEEIGLTFASCLRAILRQAPNIIMIGEIRDYETASIAIEASLTGHLVFSTLHTNDAPSAVTRLIDIGVKPFLVASSLRGVMAQRLVRNNCDNCKEEYTPTPLELKQLGTITKDLENIKLWKGRGCKKCVLTGYYGRTGIFEIMPVTDAIRTMIYEKVSATKIRERAREAGMRTLREDGLRKVLAGITTVDEVMRVTMGDIA
jgi:general secretion pathway protein E/type IV pilus assembly protein PilB